MIISHNVNYCADVGNSCVRLSVKESLAQPSLGDIVNV